jgi:aarF domain-containing kinase
VDNLEYLSKHNISPVAVSAAISAIFDEMTFISGHLHCDPHLGNVLVRPRQPIHKHDQNFQIVLLDHGLYRQLPQQLRVDYARLWLSIIQNDIPTMKYYSQLVANVPPDKFTLFASAVTGRDYRPVVKGEMAGLTVPRSVEEVRRIKKAIVGGEIMLQIVELLSNMPRIMLLLLKTNDLTRYNSCWTWKSNWFRALDVSLHIESTERHFLLMTRYCAKAVFLDRISREGTWGKVSAWWEYLRTIGRVTLYEYWLDFKTWRYRFLIPRFLYIFWIE